MDAVVDIDDEYVVVAVVDAVELAVDDRVQPLTSVFVCNHRLTSGMYYLSADS